MIPIYLPGFLPGIFRGESFVMQISFVMLIFLLFSDQILGDWGKSLRGGGGANCLRGSLPVEESQSTAEELLLKPQENLNADIETLEQWLDANKLSPNLVKTEYMIITSSLKLKCWQAN